MSIELTDEQSQALAAERSIVVEVIDPRTGQAYRLIPDEVYRQLQAVYDASPWTTGEMAALAAAAFGRLDDTDYSHYLNEPA
jgi:hypothetical protein